MSCACVWVGMYDSQCVEKRGVGGDHRWCNKVTSPTNKTLVKGRMHFVFLGPHISLWLQSMKLSFTLYDK